MITRAQRTALADLVSDDRKFIETCFKIPDKDGITVSFVLTPLQAILYQKLRKRNFWLKSRQVMATSLVTGIYTKRAMTTPNTTSVIMAHEEFITQRLLNRARFLYNSTPEELRPRIDHQSSYELRFPDINSVVYIGTARSQVAGRGEPIHNLLLSEAAFYVGGALEKIIIPALQSVPLGGTVVVESTCNGRDPFVFEEVQKVLAGKSNFTLTVVYWWQERTNTLTTNHPLLDDLPELRGQLEYTGEEKLLVELHELSEDQVRWRRYKIREMGAMFWQEHIEDLDSCFLAVGVPYYKPEEVRRLSLAARPAPFAFDGAAVWEEPVPEGQYVMGIDPGQSRNSLSAATVWRWDIPDKLTEVARLSGLIEPELMAQKCSQLGLRYNIALINPEANSLGWGLLSHIKNYPRLYRRRDVISGKVSVEIGWMTTQSTKNYMMQELQRALPKIDSWDAEFISQIGDISEKDGKVVAHTTNDIHMSGCLAVVALGGIGLPSVQGDIESTGWKW